MVRCVLSTLVCQSVKRSALILSMHWCAVNHSTCADFCKSFRLCLSDSVNRSAFNQMKNKQINSVKRSALIFSIRGCAVRRSTCADFCKSIRLCLGDSVNSSASNQMKNKKINSVNRSVLVLSMYCKSNASAAL